MALQPSRPGFMVAGALVFLVIGFLPAMFAQQPVDKRIVAVCVVIALVFLILAVQYHRQLRSGADASMGERNDG